MKFLPDGRKPDANDVWRAGQHNPYVRQCLQMVGIGELTYEEGLMAAVLALTDVNESLVEALVNLTCKRQVVYLSSPPVPAPKPT